MKVILKSWQPGVEVVTLICVIRSHTGLSLTDAKQRVEAFLAGIPIEIDFDDAARLAEFNDTMKTIGVVSEEV
ncbi:hypothetical protein [Methylobrevis albus]|uniref:Uncharacterized protein n=1 Tax=Methylobrevis albus TaxID=2793297 RepID=A0A931MYY6_9HYPH|nr:hypothetical protein [Methylobrevis albus]MBH0238942.1 hypothetical protein [Methylobrevis albus]